MQLLRAIKKLQSIFNIQYHFIHRLSIRVYTWSNPKIKIKIKSYLILFAKRKNSAISKFKILRLTKK